MNYLIHSFLFGLKAYYISGVYLVASVISFLCSAVRFVFAPFAFTEAFKLRGLFNELGAIEYFTFHIAHSVMVSVRDSEEQKAKQNE